MMFWTFWNSEIYRLLNFKGNKWDLWSWGLLLFQGCRASAAVWKLLLLSVCSNWKVKHICNSWTQKNHHSHDVCVCFTGRPRLCIHVRQSTAMSSASPRGHTSQMVGSNPKNINKIHLILHFNRRGFPPCPTHSHTAQNPASLCSCYCLGAYFFFFFHEEMTRPITSAVRSL